MFSLLLKELILDFYLHTDKYVAQIRLSWNVQLELERGISIYVTYT